MHVQVPDACRNPALRGQVKYFCCSQRATLLPISVVLGRVCKASRQLGSYSTFSLFVKCSAYVEIQYGGGGGAVDGDGGGSGSRGSMRWQPGKFQMQARHRIIAHRSPARRAWSSVRPSTTTNMEPQQTFYAVRQRGEKEEAKFLLTHTKAHIRGSQSSMATNLTDQWRPCCRTGCPEVPLHAIIRMQLDPDGPHLRIMACPPLPLSRPLKAAGIAGFKIGLSARAVENVYVQ